jgi:hypothetical protein
MKSFVPVQHTKFGDFGKNGTFPQKCPERQRKDS